VPVTIGEVDLGEVLEARHALEKGADKGKRMVVVKRCLVQLFVIDRKAIRVPFRDKANGRVPFGFTRLHDPLPEEIVVDGLEVDLLTLTHSII
jgi:hypothetical protein